MKKITIIFLLGIVISAQAQVNSRILKKENTTKDLQTKLVVPASEIEVYISIQKGIYSTNEIYSLFRGDSPKLKLYCLSYGVSSKLEIKAIDGVFPSLVDNYETIRYKVAIQKPEKPTYLVAVIDEQELNSKNAQIEIDYANESCSGVVTKNNFLGIESNYTGVFKKFDASEKNCNYINSISTNKVVKFRISYIHYEK